MNKVKIELNSEGVRELLRSQEMEDICKEYVLNAQAKLGEGYEVTTRKGKNRVNASICAKSYKARKDNSDNNLILKALR